MERIITQELRSRNQNSEYLTQRPRFVISTEGRNLSQIPRIRSG